jgi:hypothetical protein
VVEKDDADKSISDKLPVVERHNADKRICMQDKAGLAGKESADANAGSNGTSGELLPLSLADSEATRRARAARAELAKRREDGALLRNVCALANASQERKTEALWRVHGLRMREPFTIAAEPLLTKTVTESVALLEAVERTVASLFVTDWETGRYVLMRDVSGRARRRLPHGWLETLLAQTGWGGGEWWQQGSESAAAGTRMLAVYGSLLCTF